MDVIDKFQKLVALAMDTNPANIEEQRTAAMRAVALLVEHNLTVGGKPATQFESVNTKRTWAPDAEFDAFWAKMGNAEDHGYTQTDPDLPNTGKAGLVKAVLDTDIDDDFMRKRIKAAWRALQRERARLKTWIYEAEQRVGKRYPRPEPMDWEKD